MTTSGFVRLAALTCSVLAFCAVSLRGQHRSKSGCSDWGGDDRYERFCDVRKLTLPATGHSVTVDGRENGGVTVVGWDKKEILVTATIQAGARSLEDAKDLASKVSIETTGGVIRADGPSRFGKSWWWVSYEVYVPREYDLTLRANNGGLEVEGVRGHMDLSTTNGGIHLDAVAGNVRARTTNGGVGVVLQGEHWDGEGLDAETTNGGVRLDLPERYAAHLETGTVNGHIDIDFPVMVQGRLNHHIETDLGGGGKTIRVTTTNGGVAVHRR